MVYSVTSSQHSAAWPSMPQCVRVQGTPSKTLLCRSPLLIKVCQKGLTPGKRNVFNLALIFLPVEAPIGLMMKASKYTTEYCPHTVCPQSSSWMTLPSERSIPAATV